MLSQKRLKECQLVGTLRSPTAFIFTWHQCHGLVVDETYTTGRLNPKLQQMSRVLDPELDVQVKMLCQILVINIIIVYISKSNHFQICRFGCYCHDTIKGTSLGSSLRLSLKNERYHRWRPGTVCPTSAVSGRVCRTCFPDSPGIWAERRIVSHLLINPAY